MGEAYRRVSGRELIRILEEFGWYIHRIRGSHHVMRHPDVPRVTLSVPAHGNQTLPVGTQVSILKDAGIGADEFNERA
ncbi:MAG: type II toxin-antitoxin system HicA family toxin [Chloroflexota bacterium]